MDRQRLDGQTDFKVKIVIGTGKVNLSVINFKIKFTKQVCETKPSYVNGAPTAEIYLQSGFILFNRKTTLQCFIIFPVLVSISCVR